jgi:hypothetical protein
MKIDDTTFTTSDIHPFFEIAITQEGLTSELVTNKTFFSKPEVRLIIEELYRFLGDE